MNQRLASALAVSLGLGTGVAQAADGVTINGFLTAGATYSGAQPLAGSKLVSQDGNITNEWGFNNDSRFGLQISAKVNPKVDITGQLLARGREDDFNMKADWAFMTYHLTDPLSVRAGKLKLTTFLISDYIEVGYAYPWIRPPAEVYSSNPISTMNGVDLLYKGTFGDFTLLFQPYFGSSRGARALLPQEVVTAYPLCLATPPDIIDFVSCPAGTVMYADFTADSLTGVNMSIGNDAFTLRAGYLQTLVGASGFGVVADKATFSSVGATMDWRKVVVYTEYFQREVDGNANAVFTNQKGYYATLGYRLGKLLPHLTYAKLDENGGMTPGLMQSSVTAGLRYELGVGAALKMEAQQVKPDGRGLLIADPTTAGPSPSDTVNIYSVAVDVVF